jgi:hypothetical protein
MAGDWAMWLMAAALGDFVYTGDIISSYRVGHQTAVSRARHHIHMGELFTVYRTILPKATELGGFGVPAWIAKSSRKRFRGALIGTSQEYSPDERAQLIEAFRPWAQAVGEQALFDRFERGEVLRFGPIAALRPLLRKIAASLRLSLGRFA